MTDEGPQDDVTGFGPPIQGAYRRPPYPTSDATPPYGAPQPPPPFGQAPYGQAPYGQAPFGQPPYGQAPFGQSPYGQQPYQQYGYQATGSLNPFDQRGTTILILGVLGLVLCQLLAPVAWVMGRNLEAEATTAGWPEPTTGKAGRICGIIGTAILAIPVVLLLVFFVVALIGGIAGS